MTYAFYSLLTSLLSEITLDSRPFSHRTYPHGHKGVSVWSHLKVYSLPGIEAVVLWKSFPTLSCVLKMLTTNLLALDSQSQIWVEGVNRIGFHSEVILCGSFPCLTLTGTSSPPEDRSAQPTTAGRLVSSSHLAGTKMDGASTEWL